MVTLHSFDMLSTLHTYCLPCLLLGMKGLSFQKQRCTYWLFGLSSWEEVGHGSLTMVLLVPSFLYTCIFYM